MTRPYASTAAHCRVASRCPARPGTVRPSMPGCTLPHWPICAIGHIDDRPMVTIAGARAGKTSTVLEPNLLLYPGSMVVLDPKGELARTERLLAG